MTQLHLYGHSGSGHACKVAYALAMADLPHTRETIDINAPRETRPAAFLDVSPLGQVPVLLMDGRPYFQSGAILLELGQRFGVLGGDTGSGLRRAREIIVWESNRIGMAIPQLISERKGGDAELTAAVPWLRDRYETDCEMFEELLDGADFLHGATPGLGDICVYGYTSRIAQAGLSAPPALAAWLARMAEQPGMAATPDALFP